MSRFFQVRGQRAIFQENADGKPRRVGTTSQNFLRYESLFQHDAENFATDVYRRENIICTIDEVSQ